MAETAFLLIKLDRNTPAEVARLLRALSGIDEAHAVMGEYDVLAVVRTNATRDITTLVEKHVRTIDGVAQVVTCVTVPV